MRSAAWVGVSFAGLSKYSKCFQVLLGPVHEDSQSRVSSSLLGPSEAPRPAVRVLMRCKRFKECREPNRMGLACVWLCLCMFKNIPSDPGSGQGGGVKRVCVL